LRVSHEKPKLQYGNVISQKSSFQNALITCQYIHFRKSQDIIRIPKSQAMWWSVLWIPHISKWKNGQLGVPIPKMTGNHTSISTKIVLTIDYLAESWYPATSLILSNPDWKLQGPDQIILLYSPSEIIQSQLSIVCFSSYGKLHLVICNR